MRDLRQLWKIGGLVEDQNKDGVADRVNVSIHLEEDMRPEGLIDFCARLGFETTSLSFDFLENNKRYQFGIHFNKSNETAIEWQDKDLLFYYENEGNLSVLLRFLASDWYEDFIQEEVVEKIALEQNKFFIYGRNKIVRSVDIGFKGNAIVEKEYTLHSLTDVWSDLGFLHDKEPSPTNKHAVTFHPEDGLKNEAWDAIYYGAARIGMESTALAFPMTGKNLNNGLQFRFQPTEFEKATIQLNQNEITFEGEAESLTNAISYFFSEKHWSFGGHFASWDRGLQKPQDRPEEILFNVKWDDDGEVTELYQHLEEWKQDIPSTDPVNITIYISESEKIRKIIQQKVKQLYTNATIMVRSAFKPGYFWLTEEIIPSIKQLDKTIGSITIHCLQEEKEDGLELPVRWIQEIYPVDEIMANELQLNVEDITFELSKDLGSTYEIVVKDTDNNEIHRNALSIPVSKVPYIDGEKYSYPTTSYVSMKTDDAVLHEASIVTDRERFYQYYINDILPKLWQSVDVVDKESGFKKPLFDRIEINVEMSEEEMKIPVAQERISSLEALHEDLYFNTLDFFKVKGEQKVGKGFTAPGGVYPFMKVKSQARPNASITVYNWKDEIQPNLYTEQLVFQQDQSKPIEVTYRSDDGQRTEIITETEEREEIPHDVPKPQYADMYTWLCDYSYRGHPIYVYEFFKDTKEDYYSAIKMSTQKPTILIETGHHANEVSSMPAVTELMDEITEMHPHILDHLNFAIIPRANPDGTALHQRMIKDNPEWKHHAARYNAVGLEFGHVRYQDSPFGEANVVPKIMNRWAPDIVIDDHGIPSHEWTQPFAGYHNPPSFPMSFWIPNAFIYGIARKLDEAEFPQHAAILDKITHEIQSSVVGTEIQEMNQYWLKRYQKYGNTYMPDMFPIELTNDFIFYKWAAEPDETSRNSINRFPEWVSADLISEAADETVYGDVLEMCKKAHRMFDLGAIKWINKDDQTVKQTLSNGEIVVERIRPLSLNK
ncbi:M14 family metallopeptidase [Oceanobacillus halotolerans]|uniref:M14 family metallopeptidase n=1 Tax=Oceanobacillus halotolerans TaxID=2663380 RepID=UPI0013D9579C|nr:M14 family metallopeptidase [Oceanobacillus halotolerans]